MSNANRDIEDCRSTLERYYEKGLNDGRNEVWEFLKAFCGMDVGERQKVFGEYAVNRLVENMSPQKVLENLEAYEKANKIKVGDVVFGDDEPDVYGIVTFVSCEMIYIMWSDGSSGVEYDFRDIKKTGKQIDITSVLEQLRGDEYDSE